MHDDSTAATHSPTPGPAPTSTREALLERETAIRTELTAVERRSRELWAELATVQAQTRPPMHDDTRRQLDDYKAIEEMGRRGELEQFHGEYVFVLNGKVIDHGPDPEVVRARVAAAGHGVSVSRIPYRFIH